MLTALIGAFCGGGGPDLDGVAAAVGAMGLAGETAARKSCGTGSFRTMLMDAVNNMNDEILKEDLRIEEFK